MESPGVTGDEDVLALSLYAQQSPPLSRKGPKQVRNRFTHDLASCNSAGWVAGGDQRLFSKGAPPLATREHVRQFSPATLVGKAW